MAGPATVSCGMHWLVPRSLFPVVLIAAGLLLRGLYQAQTIDPGFEMQNVASASIYGDKAMTMRAPESSSVN